MKIFRFFIVFLSCHFVFCSPVYCASSMVPKILSVGDFGVVYRDGNLGIGTSVPQTRLDVSGNVMFSPTVARASTVLSSVVYVSGNTVDWTKGALQVISVGNTSRTITFTAPSGPAGLLLIIYRTGTGTLNFPSSVKWAGGLVPSFSYTQRQVPSQGNATDIAGFIYDGTNFIGEANLNFF